MLCALAYGEWRWFVSTLSCKDRPTEDVAISVIIVCRRLIDVTRSRGDPCCTGWLAKSVFLDHDPAPVDECIPQASQPVTLSCEGKASRMLDVSQTLPYQNVSPDQAGKLASQWLEVFIHRGLDEPRASPSTREAYSLDVTMLSRWAVNQNKHLLSLDAPDLTRYLRERFRHGTHPSTLARHLSSCRRFYAFLLSQGVGTHNPAESVAAPRVARRKRRLVPDDVLRRVMEPRTLPVASAASAFRAQRDHVIVCMLYDTALGISDIRLLRWEQINEQWKVVVVPGRNGLSRSFVLSPRLLEALRELRRRTASWGFETGDTPYCFPTSTGLPMSRQALCFAVRKWTGQCEPQEAITPSTLRQTGLAHQARRARPVPTASVGP